MYNRINQHQQNPTTPNTNNNNTTKQHRTMQALPCTRWYDDAAIRQTGQSSQVGKSRGARKRRTEQQLKSFGVALLGQTMAVKRRLRRRVCKLVWEASQEANHTANQPNHTIQQTTQPHNPTKPIQQTTQPNQSNQPNQNQMLEQLERLDDMVHKLQQTILLCVPQPKRQECHALLEEMRDMAMNNLSVQMDLVHVDVTSVAGHTCVQQYAKTLTAVRGLFVGLGCLANNR